MYDELVPVLIVGGGPVGLALSLFLARAGVQSLLIERHPSTTIHPRARGINIRTMEVFRSAELADALRAVGSTLDLGRFTLVVDTLAGEERQRILPQGDPANYDYARSVSPEEWCLCAQDELEPRLLQAAQQQGGIVRFSTELIGLEQDESGVTAQVVNRITGAKSTIRCLYMLAADGANSRVRDEIVQVPLIGERVLAYHINIYFRADLTEFVKDRPFVMCHVENPNVRGIFFTVNDTDRWLFNIVYHPEQGEKPEDYPAERCIDIVRKAVGVPDLDVEVLSTLPWEAATCIAQQFQIGRVFLAGDAAHIMPPFGASGVNIGVQDAHNLAWKLAAVIRGSAGAELLTTYDTERRIVGELTIQQADFRHKGLRERSHGDDISKAAPTFKEQIEVMLGYCYDSLAVIAEEAYPPTGLAHFDARPGSRAPHFWLEQGGKQISSLDLVGQGFVLLTGEEGTAWLDGIARVAQQMEYPLCAYRIGPGGDLSDREQRFLALYRISSRGAVIIRPDGFVAWKSYDSVADPERTLKQTLQQLLACSPSFSAQTEPDVQVTQAEVPASISAF